MFRKITYLSILLSVCAVCCNQVAGQSAGGTELSKLIPAPLPAGLAAQQAPTFYNPDNLYKYMDGGADIFLLYGVRELMHLELRANAVDVTVDVFDMESADNAFGIYAAERSPSYHFVNTGAEGYRDQGILNFLQDRYYVKLAGFGQGADAALETFARALSTRIGGNSALPALLAQLPAENRKPHSEQYMPNDPLGHAFLGPAYVVAYTAGDQESRLFVTLARDEADARQRLKQLEEHFAKTGESRHAPEMGESGMRGSNSFEGKVMAQTKGHYLLLLLNPAAGSEKLFAAASESLK